MLLWVSCLLRSLIPLFARSDARSANNHIAKYCDTHPFSHRERIYMKLARQWWWDADVYIPITNPSHSIRLSGSIANNLGKTAPKNLISVG